MVPVQRRFGDPSGPLCSLPQQGMVEDMIPKMNKNKQYIDVEQTS